MIKKMGTQSVKFQYPVNILSTASVVGPKETEGPLSEYFDVKLEDILAGQQSWEKAESEIVKQAFELAIKKSGLLNSDIDYMLCGDLLNQNIGSTFGIRDLNIPFFGLFGACSTMGEGMALGAMLIDGGFANNVLVGASSHFCSAEKQFRFPLDLGSQRPLTSSWTVTGDGSAVLNREGEGPFITGVSTGKIIDMGIKDINNMGAAMAPAASAVIASHFRDFGIGPSYYDLIITGDLGYVGHDLLTELLREEGFDISSNSSDCGIKIFDKDRQDTHAGGSGCGCAAVTFAGFLYDKLKKKEINKLLFVPTGALLSPISMQQGETIPGIAHAIAIENMIPTT